MYVYRLFTEEPTAYNDKDRKRYSKYFIVCICVRGETDARKEDHNLATHPRVSVSLTGFDSLFQKFNYKVPLSHISVVSHLLNSMNPLIHLERARRSANAPQGKVHSPEEPENNFYLTPKKVAYFLTIRLTVPIISLQLLLLLHLSSCRKIV
jgi:hypothetical protein